MGDRRGYNSYRGNERNRHDDRQYHDNHRSNYSNGSESRSRPEDRSTPRWSWASTIISAISLTIFASVFGVFGLLFSGLSYTDHKVGDYKRSRYKRWWAYCCGVSGICITIIAISLLMMIMFWFAVEKPTFKHHQYWIPYWLYDQLGNNTSS